MVGAAGSNQTPKVSTSSFAWNANTTSLGIGTSSPTGLIQLTGSTWRKGVLETTGVTAKAYQGSDTNGLNFTSNIYWSGSAWVQDDATRACFAYIQHLGNSRMEFRVAPAGAFPGWTTAMVIDSTGNVGIGTTSPTEKLQVSGSSADTFAFINTTGATKSGISLGNNGSTYGQLYFDNANNNVSLLQKYASGSLILGTNSTERMRIFSSGGVSIGNTTDPGVNNLSVTGTVAGSNITAGGNVTGSSTSCTGNAATATTATNQSGGTVSATTGSFSGVLTSPKTLVNRSSGAATGIGWYSNTYSAWTQYMSPAAATGCGPYANITAPTGTLVTSWGQRSFIENSAGYGWTFESGTASQTTPTVVAEIRSSDGSARFSGSITAGSDIVRSNISQGSIYLTGSLPGYADNTYPTLRSSGYLYFSANGAYSAYIYGLDFVSRGNVTAYSDERKKKNWRSVADNFVEKLAVVKAGVYDRVDEEITQVGVSAQSLQEVLPEAVLTDNDGYLSVAYGNAAMTAAVELAKELVALKELVKELKAEVDELKSK
jgi:hypothetical protein